MEQERSLMTTLGQQDVVILCGGLGTRLRAVVSDRPKPMALINGQPFLDLLVDHVVSQGFHRIIFSTGHHGAWIAEHVKKRTDIDAIISHEDQPLGTAGALRACRSLLMGATFLVLNGDSLCRIDLPQLIATHHAQQAVATVAVTLSNGRTDGGGITLDEHCRIVRFEEKKAGSYINTGIYALQTGYLDRIPHDTPCSLERDVFPALVTHGLYGYPCHAPLYDIGTPERLEEFRSVMHGRRIEDAEKGAPC